MTTNCSSLQRCLVSLSIIQNTFRFQFTAHTISWFEKKAIALSPYSHCTFLSNHAASLAINFSVSYLPDLWIVVPSRYILFPSVEICYQSPMNTSSLASTTFVAVFDVLYLNCCVVRYLYNHHPRIHPRARVQ